MLANSHSNHHSTELSDVSKQALAELALEGIEVSPELLSDMHRLDLGELSDEQFLARAIARAV